MELSFKPSQPLIRCLIFLGVWMLLALVPSRASAQALYKVYGPRGIVTFTSRPPATGSKFSVLTPKQANFSMVYSSRGMSMRALETKYDSLIREKAQEHAVEPALVKAVIHAESAFNPLARSNKGAMGLMQLMPGTAERMGVSDAYHPEQNVSGGIKYLKFLLERYNGNLRLALAAYNAGEGAVDKLKQIPPYSETVQYVQKVLSLHRLYQNKETSVRKP